MVLHTLGVVLDSVICVCDRWEFAKYAASSGPDSSERETRGSPWVAAVKGSRRVVLCGLRATAKEHGPFRRYRCCVAAKGSPPTMFREFRRLCPFRPLPPGPTSPGYSAVTQ